MIEVLAANKQAIERELRERIQAFLNMNNLTTDCVSITMQFFRSTRKDEMPTIKILIIDRDSGDRLHESQVIA